MRRDDQRQAVKNIPLEQLKPFKNHPFQVRDDEEFRRLVESIEIHGVIHPAVARQIGEDCYELISGHRRKAACEVLGYSEMPVLVRSMTDDEAVVNTGSNMPLSLWETKWAWPSAPLCWPECLEIWALWPINRRTWPCSPQYITLSPPSPAYCGS